MRGRTLDRGHAKEDRAATEFLRREIRGALLPYVPGEPRHLAAAIAAPGVTRDMLDGLAFIYGVDTWNLERFTRHVLEGALPAWKLGTRVSRGEDEIRVASPVCPFASDRAIDPRICDLCALVHEGLVKTAAPNEVRDVRFAHVADAVDSSCTLVITKR